MSSTPATGALAAPARAGSREAAAAGLQRARALVARPDLWVLLGVALLTAAAAVQELRALGAQLWIDEGISLGIASHPLTEIPGVLLQDGSPPLYYVLLHLWSGAFGTSVTSAHTLSAVCAIAAVPAAAWAAWPLFGRGAALTAAALIALNPFVGLYADEVRMYALVLLLALLATGAFLRAFVLHRSRWSVGFGVLLALVLYAHNWGLFFGAAAGLAWLGLLAAGPDRRTLLRDGAIGFGLAVVLFAPWVPSLLDQARHTGAPWSHRPTITSLGRALERMVGGAVPETLLLLIGAVGLVELLRRSDPVRRRAALAVLAITAATLLVAWTWSRVDSPAWAMRYLVIVLAPLTVVVAAGLARTGLIAVAVIGFLLVVSWHGKPSAATLEHKSNVTTVARRLGPLPGGSLVISPQPEQVPLLRRLLGGNVRYLTTLGPVADPTVMDWRDALRRLRAAHPRSAVRSAIAQLPTGTRVLFVAPRFSHPDAPWTRLIRRQTRSLSRDLAARLTLVSSVVPRRGSSRSTVIGRLYVVQRPVHRHGHRRH